MACQICQELYGESEREVVEQFIKEARHGRRSTTNAVSQIRADDRPSIHRRLKRHLEYTGQSLATPGGQRPLLWRAPTKNRLLLAERWQ